MLVTIIIIILVAGLAGIGYGIRAIARELDGIEGEANRRGAEHPEGHKDAKRDAEKLRTAQEKMAERKLLWGVEKWREGK